MNANTDLVDRFRRCAYAVCTTIDPRGYRWSEAYLDELLREVGADTDTPPVEELPGMWDRPDFTGGDPDERSHSARPEGQSVEQRARELFARQLESEGYYVGLIEQVRAANVGHYEETVIRALEQALTQQRGEVSYDAGMAMHWIERYAAGIDEECQLDRIAEAFTTPQPSADAVRELVKRWRGLSVKSHRDGQYQGHDTLRLCADELESLLSAASDEKGVG